MDFSATKEEKLGAIQRLTALWALSESGLGGIMFALKIPFTGFFLGAFAVIIISLIAYISERDHKQIIQATILVVMVKAMASPHSPPPAYLAVAFQGFAGALIFRMRYFKTACILLGILSMLESAAQKIISITVVFGNNIWAAVNKLFTDFGLSFKIHGLSMAFLLIGTYLVLYACWGAVVGVWASRMPDSLEAYKTKIAAQHLSTDPTLIITPERKGNKIKHWVFFILILLFISLVFIFNGGSNKLLRIFLRSFSAVLLLYFIVRPIVKYLLTRWLQNQQGKRKQAEELILLMPQMRGYVSAAYRLAKQQSSAFAKTKDFIIYLVGFALYGK